jgi:hypothetical protein
MAGEKLSKRVVAVWACAKDYIVFDGEQPGFGVRVMPNGKRFYLIQYRRRGQDPAQGAGPSWLGGIAAQADRGR